MEKLSQKAIDRNFFMIFLLYMAYYNCMTIITVNIDHLLMFLPGITASGIALMGSLGLITGFISILFFGYCTDKISDKISRKTIFLVANSIIATGFLLVAFSVNFQMMFICYIIASSGSGVFLPVGYSIIGDSYPPKERGKKFGVMQLALLMGSGGGVIFGALWGSLFGAIGWRVAYGIGAGLIIISLILYSKNGIEITKGQAEPEFNDFKGELQNYSYKITFSSISHIFKKRSMMGIVISVLLGNIAATTLGLWQIFVLSNKIDHPNASTIAILVIILGGLGGLYGSIAGGKIGDSCAEKGFLKGRALISLIGVLISNTLNILFYIILPFYVATIEQFILFFALHLIIYFLILFFGGLGVGNAYAIYSEVCPPEDRSIANAISGLAALLGGAIGNLIISIIIFDSIDNLPIAILLILIIALIGNLFWLFPFFFYPKEAKTLRDLMTERRQDMDRQLNEKNK